MVTLYQSRGKMTDSGAAAGRDQPRLLDADTLIDEILAKKGPQKYKEGLSEDNWEEELERIPLFATKSPEVVDAELAPGLAALQDLKYELSSTEGRAKAHKEEGNEQFRLKHYQKAVDEYSAGVKEGVELRNEEGKALLAILYTNRAAAQFHLGNLRSCINDVTKAKQLKTDHLKAYHRGGLACMKLGYYEEAVRWCDEGLRVSPEDSKLRELRSKATKEKKHKERDQRKQALAEKAVGEERKKLLAAIECRGIKLATAVSLDDDSEGVCSTDPLELRGPHPTGEKVHFDPTGRLVWPVLFLYPEHGQTDIISAFSEDQRFIEHIEVMFGEQPPAWDDKGFFKPDAIQVYFEDSSGGGLINVDVHQTLGSVLSMPGHTIVAGTPSFIILSSKSPFTRHFLKQPP